MSDNEMKPNEVEDKEDSKEKAPEPPKWEYRSEFGAVKQMREIVGLTMKATESEIEALHRKLERLQYGS